MTEVLRDEFVLFTFGPALTRLIDAIATSRYPAPCVGHSRLWTSTHQVDRQLAVTLCREHCAFLYLCEDAADEEDPDMIDGVWAGVDRRPASVLRLRASEKRKRDEKRSRRDQPQRKEPPMIEQLQEALRAVPVIRLEEFKAFCARQWKADTVPSGAFWHALAGVVAEALDDVREEIQQLEDAVDDEGGIGEQVT